MPTPVHTVATPMRSRKGAQRSSRSAGATVARLSSLPPFSVHSPRHTRNRHTRNTCMMAAVAACIPSGFMYTKTVISSAQNFIKSIKSNLFAEIYANDDNYTSYTVH